MSGPLLVLLIVATVLAVDLAIEWEDARRKVRRRAEAERRHTTEARFLGRRR